MDEDIPEEEEAQDFAFMETQRAEVRRNVNDLIDCVMGQLNNNT